ncbi:MULTISPECIES: LPXTG cell wall anchor domain-containing protein [Staphylococcus]|uniref:LPXTG cell wall anchor domain-containing protein n=1 Tax=Staphylococcus cohnii TaxID=29382 RepID=A0ABT6J2C9_9STAP|nr:LPXTG cell wall anchor domain-containing protein [Staphylococcus cohnii]AYX91016.1 LPXTG cell wall anchor domain-containing protein [Staphylococcus cohnii]MCI2942045.1 LPXTG cell wall anchor domain-containing protein [Staphylococcus cohnii]MDE1710534.1 LPXTG cell wall anchor domain-containing protein [Staphylococcus cohnii]MDH5140810.1 LPXTG cell wall anchor domain-containing protein [Staphylococcus cohnii]MDH5158887.1 LPXTG cell wall anchor domain-containing protein [Staphylococcus cohnii]
MSEVESESMISSDSNNSFDSTNTLESSNDSDSENEANQNEKDKDSELPNTGEDKTKNGLLAGILRLGGLSLLRRRRKKGTENN